MKNYNNPRAWLSKLSDAFEEKLYYMGFCSESDWNEFLLKWGVMFASGRLSAHVVRSNKSQQDALKFNDKPSLFFEISDPYYKNRTLNIERRHLYVPEELAEKIVVLGGLP